MWTPSNTINLNENLAFMRLSVFFSLHSHTPFSVNNQKLVNATSFKSMGLNIISFNRTTMVYCVCGRWIFLSPTQDGEKLRWHEYPEGVLLPGHILHPAHTCLWYAASAKENSLRNQQISWNALLISLKQEDAKLILNKRDRWVSLPGPPSCARLGGKCHDWACHKVVIQTCTNRNASL